MSSDELQSTSYLKSKIPRKQKMFHMSSPPSYIWNGIEFTKEIFDFKRKPESVVKSILQNEADTLKRQNPDYDFKNITAGKLSDYGSCTYTLIFRKR